MESDKPVLSRRGFLTTSALGVSALACSASNLQAKSGRPNVVVVIADDLSREDLGCYGGMNIQTPHIDQVAWEGMRFERAFTATAMCAPMRMQFYTGLYPVRSGAYPNHSRVKEGVRSVAHYLGDLGYRAGLIGKWHIAPPEAFPFERVPGTMSPRGDWDGVRDFMTRDEAEPFCLFVCSNQPHTPWDRGDAAALDPEKLKLQPQWVDTPDTRVALSRYYAEAQYFDEQVGTVDRLLLETGHSADTILIVVTEQGSILPGAKWTCYEQGLRVGMLVRWPGVVAPGEVVQAMVDYVDVTPTLVDAAGGGAIDGLDGSSFLGVLRGTRDEHNSYSYGVQTSKGAVGAPRTGYGVRSIRSDHFKYILNLNPEVSYKNWVTEVDGESFWASWVAKAKEDPEAKRLLDRYVNRPREELYDLRSDPYEMLNLADDPVQAAVKADLRARLVAWMASQGDDGQPTEMAAPTRQKRSR